MAGASIFDIPTVPRLQSLLEDVRRGQILIPRFQRPFVWKDEQRLQLLDSISRGMPIGSLLVWRTSSRHRLESFPRLGPFPLQPPPAESAVRTYLLDGHQRLTTLYAALCGRPEDAVPSTGDSEEDEDETRWPIYYDLAASGDDLRFRLAPRRGEVPGEWLPLYRLFDPVALYEFQRGLIDRGQRELARGAEQLANQFKDYPVPVVPIITEDLDLVIESFKRINRQGQRLDEAHMLAALTYGKSFDFAHRFEEINEQIATLGWGPLDHQIYVNLLKVACGLDVYKAEPTRLFNELTKKERLLDELADHVTWAIGFLRERCGIAGPAMLPYTYQLIVLAEVARASGGKIDAKPEQVKLLESWFWLTTYTEWFTGVTSTRIREMIQVVQQAVQEENWPWFFSSVDIIGVNAPAGIQPLRRFDFNAVRGKAFALLLARLQPRDSKREVIAAQHVLGEYGVEALIRIVPDRSGRLPENRCIGGPKDARNLRKALREPPGLFDLRELWASHGIPPVAGEALRRGDVSLFLEKRRAFLRELEKEFVEGLGLKYRDEAE